MNKTKNQKYETVEDLINYVVESVATNPYIDGDFHCIDDYVIDNGLLDNFKTLPELPKKEQLLAKIKESSKFQEYMDGCAEEVANGLMMGIKLEIEYREEEAEAEKERLKEEEEDRKWQAQQDKLQSKKTKNKQALAKTLTPAQKKSLKESFGISL